MTSPGTTATATVSPDSTSLTVANRGTFSENITVNIPAQGAIPKIDVYFLTDSTSSMGDAIAKVRDRTTEILSKLRTKSEEVGADVGYGVGNYRDLSCSKEEWFSHQLSITKDTGPVEVAIKSWSTGGNKTTAEGQFYALDQLAQATGGSIGWRWGAKRIIVWMGDAPGHDPICSSVSGLSDPITESSVIGKLRKQGIFVIAISVGPAGGSSPGLDVDPVPHSDGPPYKGNCDIGGREEQASRITAATGGTFADEINPDDLVDKIIELGAGQISKINRVKLAPTPQILPFITDIQPEKHGPLTGGSPHDLEFKVSYSGVTSGGSAPITKPITINGEIEVKVDGVPTGSKQVEIVVPDLSGKYKIQCTLTNLYLGLEDPNWTGDGGNITQDIDQNEPHQKWELIPNSGGGYLIKNTDPVRGRHLEVVGESKDNGTEILTREDPTGDHKQWELVPVGADDQGMLFKIRNVNSRKVLDIQDGNEQPGARIIQWGYWGDLPTPADRREWEERLKKHNQHWRLIKQ